MRNFSPGSREFNERLITRKQKGFRDGVFSDLPASELPAGAVAKAQNYVLHPNIGAVARPGTISWSATALPSLRTGYSWSKSGSTITATVGAEFSAFDIGRYVVHDDGKHELITGVTSSTVVTVSSSTIRAASTAGWIRGPYELYFHKGENRLILHIDTRLYESVPDTIAWNQIFPIGPHALAETKTKCFDELDNYGILHNDEMIFQIDPVNRFYWARNGAAPSVQITDIAKTSSLPYGYRFLYTMSRLRGCPVLGDRTSTDVVLEQESGPTKTDAENFRDYGEIWTADPIGEESTTFGRLTGDTLPAAYDTIAEWQAVTDGQFKITIDGTERNIGSLDFSKETTWEEIATVIQGGLRDAFPNSKPTCEWSVDHFILESPLESGSITVVSAGDGGTDIGTAAMACESGTGTASTPNFTADRTFGTVTIPIGNGQIYSHWTHYSAYRNLNMGVDGIDPQTGAGNQKELYVWEGDYPVAKAFTAQVLNNVIIANTSVFSQRDVGDTVVFVDATNVVITDYTDATHVTCSNANVAEQAACVGGGIITSLTQADTTITCGAAVFAVGDVGKVIFWEDGDTSVITGYTSGTEVEAYPSMVKPSQSATFSPASRTVNSITRDTYNGTSTTITQLASRAAGFSLYNRFWEELPAGSNTGAIVNGFLITAVRGERRVNYSQMPEGQEYLTGYYNQQKQTILLQDAVRFIIAFEDQVAVICDHSIVGIPMNNFTAATIEEVGETVFVITGTYNVSETVGCRDWGSIIRTPNNEAFFITSEPNFRKLSLANSGRLVLSEKLDYPRFSKNIQKTGMLSAAAYDPNQGYLVWTKETTPTISEDLVWEDEYAVAEDFDDEYRDEDIIEVIYS